MLQSGFLNAKREGKYVEKWLLKVLKKSFVLLQVVVRLPQRRMYEGNRGIVVIALFLYRKKASPGEVDAGEA